MMPLRHQLGADDDVHMAVLDRFELLAHALRGGDQVAGEHHDAPLGKSAAASSSSRSTPGPQATNWSLARHFGQVAGRGVKKPQ